MDSRIKMDLLLTTIKINNNIFQAFAWRLPQKWLETIILVKWYKSSDVQNLVVCLSSADSYVI